MKRGLSLAEGVYLYRTKNHPGIGARRPVRGEIVRVLSWRSNRFDMSDVALVVDSEGREWGVRPRYLLPIRW
jgi:hypothetical protein